MALVLAAASWFALVVSYWWLTDPQLPASKLVVGSLILLAIPSAFLVGCISAPILAVIGIKYGWRWHLLLAASWTLAVWAFERSNLSNGFVPDRFRVAAAIVALFGALLGPLVAYAMLLPLRLRKIRRDADLRQAEVWRDHEQRMAKLAEKNAQFLATSKQHSEEQEHRRALRNYFRS